MTKGTPSTPFSAPGKHGGRILAAALACFERHGIAKTTMEDIAKAAGLGKKTVYRTYSSRTALLDALAMQRISVVFERVKAVVDSCATLEDAVIRGVLEGLRLVREDTIFMALVENTNRHGVERYLIDPRTSLAAPMLSIWRGAFERARGRGEWRRGLTNMEAITWLRSVQLVLLLREDLGSRGQKAFLKKFVLPAMTNSLRRG